MTNKLLKVTLILSLIFSTSQVIAAELQAQVTQNNENQTLQTTQTTETTPTTQTQATQPTQTTQTCDRAKKVQDKLNQLNKEKRPDTINYISAMEKIESIIEKRAKEGYATSSLREYLQQWSGKIAQFTNNFYAVTKALTESQQYACDQADDKFKEQIQKSRDALKKVRDSIGEIKKYYSEILRPELLSLTKLNTTGEQVQ